MDRKRAVHGQDENDITFTFRHCLPARQPRHGNRQKGPTYYFPVGKDYLGSKKAVYMANIFGMRTAYVRHPEDEEIQPPHHPRRRRRAHRTFPRAGGKVPPHALRAARVISIAYSDPGRRGLGTPDLRSDNAHFSRNPSGSSQVVALPPPRGGERVRSAPTRHLGQPPDG